MSDELSGYDSLDLNQDRLPNAFPCAWCDAGDHYDCHGDYDRPCECCGVNVREINTKFR